MSEGALFDEAPVESVLYEPTELIILPLDDVIFHCRNQLVQLTRLFHVSRSALLKDIFRLAHQGNYERLRSQIHERLVDTTLLNRGQREFNTYLAIDALLTVHGEMMDCLSRFYPHRWRRFDVVNVVEPTALYLRMYPA